jgi:hypothetical protein
MYVILFWIFGTWRVQSSLSFMAHFASLCEGTCPIVNREILPIPKLLKAELVAFLGSPLTCSV